MKRLLVAAAMLCTMATLVHAQAGLAGKWETDPPAAGGGRGGGAATRLDLKVEGAKVTGTIFEGGAELPLIDGTVTAKQAKFKTERTNNGVTLKVNWTADLTDDNTVTLSREFPEGIPAGFLGGGGGGGRGGRGGGAPGGGAPPAGGAAPAAGAAAPAAPAAGAPPAGGGAPGGGGGGGGRGGGRGGGGGAPAPVTLHRAK